MLSGFTATFACKTPSYFQVAEQEYNEIECIDGEWDRALDDSFCLRGNVDLYYEILISLLN